MQARRPNAQGPMMGQSVDGGRPKTYPRNKNMSGFNILDNKQVRISHWFTTCVASLFSGIVFATILGFGTAVLSRPCTAADDASHTCATAFVKDSEAGAYPDYLTNIGPLAGVVFLASLAAGHVSHYLADIDFDPVITVLRILGGFLNKDARSDDSLHRILGALFNALGLFVGVLFTWALLASRSAYNDATAEFQYGSGLGAPKLSYFANVGIDSALTFIVILFTTFRVVYRLWMKSENNANRGKESLNHFAYVISVALFDAASVFVVGILYGTATVSWTRDLFAMIMRSDNSEPAGAKDGYILFIAWTALAHVGGLCIWVLLMWAKRWSTSSDPMRYN